MAEKSRVTLIEERVGELEHAVGNLVALEAQRFKANEAERLERLEQTVINLTATVKLLVQVFKEQKNGAQKSV